MKKILLALLGVVALGTVAFVSYGVWLAKNPVPTPEPTPQEQPQNQNENPTPPAEEPEDEKKISEVKIFFVVVGDNGKTGKMIGCGDSLVAVSKTIKPTTAPLKAAFEEFLSIRTQYYGQSGLYNSLYQSRLTVDRIIISAGGKASVYLKGTAMLAGECDDPRAISQLEELALQFPEVKTVAVYINGKNINDLFSEKG